MTADLEFTVPVSVRDTEESLAGWPHRRARVLTSGPCVECRADTENTDDGDFICEGCLEDLRAAQREDHRLDDPRHGQGGR